MGFPVHKPYIQLIEVSTSILGTWNVWWINSIQVDFPSHPEAGSDDMRLALSRLQLHGDTTQTLHATAHLLQPSGFGNGDSTFTTKWAQKKTAYKWGYNQPL